jgi:hypothetical protein
VQVRVPCPIPFAVLGKAKVQITYLIFSSFSEVRTVLIGHLFFQLTGVVGKVRVRLPTVAINFACMGS